MSNMTNGVGPAHDRMRMRGVLVGNKDGEDKPTHQARFLLRWLCWGKPNIVNNSN